MAYFANGSEAGALLFDAQCTECPIAESGCPVRVIQELYNYDQCENDQPADVLGVLVGDDEGCRMFPRIRKAVSRRE